MASGAIRRRATLVLKNKAVKMHICKPMTEKGTHCIKGKRSTHRRKKGFPPGSGWQRGLLFSLSVPYRHKWSVEFGQTNAGGGARNGKKEKKKITARFRAAD